MISHLRLIVLANLARDDLSGYSLMKNIKEKTGCWKPSAGSIYPLLEELLQKNLVTVKKVDRKKVYSLTSLGKNELKSLLGNKKAILNHIIEGVKTLQILYGKKEIKKLIEHALK